MPDGSSWPQKIFTVRAFLQHRIVDAQTGEVVWENVGTWELISETYHWKLEFPMVSVTDGFKAADYRVREAIQHFNSYPADSSTRTYFKDTAGLDDGMKALLVPEDEDYVENRSYVFTAMSLVRIRRAETRRSFLCRLI